MIVIQLRNFCRLEEVGFPYGQHIKKKKIIENLKISLH